MKISYKKDVMSLEGTSERRCYTATVKRYEAWGEDVDDGGRLAWCCPRVPATHKAGSGHVEEGTSIPDIPVVPSHSSRTLVIHPHTPHSPRSKLGGGRPQDRPGAQFIRR